VTLRVAGNMECNDGAVLHAWALAGRGLAWRSMWEVSADIEAGRLVPVLEDSQQRVTISMRCLRNAAIYR